MTKNLIASIIASAGLFLIFFLIVPEYDAIAAARVDLGVHQALLQERTEEFQKVQSLDQDYKKHAEDIKKILVFLPETKQTDGLISNINAAVTQAGIQLSGMDVAAAQQDTAVSYRTTGVHLTLVASYAAMLNFLQSLEQNLRIFDVSELSASTQQNASGGLNISIKINAYNLK